MARTDPGRIRDEHIRLLCVLLLNLTCAPDNQRSMKHGATVYSGERFFTCFGVAS